MSAKKKKPRGRPFTGREDSRNRQNVLLAQAAEFGGATALSMAGPPEKALAAMQYVSTHPAQKGESYQRKQFREAFEKNPIAFSKAIMDAEAAQGGDGPDSEMPVEDPGTDAAI